MKKRILSLVVIAIVVMVNTIGAFATQSDSIKLVGKYGTPVFTVGELSAPSKDTPENIAVKYLEANRTQFKATGSFKVKAKTLNNEGATVVRVQQTYNDLPVFGYEQKVVVDQNGVVRSSSGLVIPGLDKQTKLKELIKISDTDAIKVAQADYGKEVTKYETAPTAELGIYLKEDVANLVYLVNLNFLYPEPGNWDYYISASTGTVIDKLNKIEFVIGKNTTNIGYGVLGDQKTINVVKRLLDGNYYMQDKTRGANIYTYSCENGTFLLPILRNPCGDDDGVWDDWSDHACVDAHYYAGIVWDYYKKIHNRNSYDNAGATIKSNCHYGINYNNAFWNGFQMVYGDGDGIKFIEFSGGIDVIAHELTHAVTGYEANLTYKNESGAINEAYSDIFGTLVEFYNGKNPDWLLGEDIYTPDISGDAFRSMSNPSEYGHPDNYANKYTGFDDNGGVHKNSGIINKAAYLLSQGGKAYGVNVTGIGNDKMGAIFYKALIDSVVSSETMSQLRVHCVAAATALYGSTSTEVTQVKNAFSAVGIN